MAHVKNSTNLRAYNHCIAKLHILERYLQAWLPINSTHNENLVFIDCFSGSTEYLFEENGEIKIEGSPIRAILTFFDFFNLWSEPKRQQKQLKEFTFWFNEFDEEKYNKLQTNTLNAAIKMFGIYSIDFTLSKCEVEFDDHQLVEFLIKKNQFEVKLIIKYTKCEFVNMDFSEYLYPGFNKVFCFIDPFNYAAVPMSKIQEMIWFDILLTMMSSGVVRNITKNNEQIKTGINEFFGTDEWQDLRDSNDKSVKLRSLYQRQLTANEMPKRHTLSFTMKSVKNSDIYHMIFCTSFRLSYIRMKESMFTYDQSIESNNEARDYMFSDYLFRQTHGQEAYFEVISLKYKKFDRNSYFDAVASNVCRAFRNQKREIHVMEIEDYVWFTTPYIFRKQCLRHCAKNGYMFYCRENGACVNKNSFKFRANTFHNVVIWFFKKSGLRHKKSCLFLFLKQLKKWFPQGVDFDTFKLVVRHSVLYYLLNLKNVTRIYKLFSYIRLYFRNMVTVSGEYIKFL